VSTIEFSAPVDGLDLRRQPRMADTRPVAAAAVGPDPRTRHWPPVKHPTPAEERRIYPGEGRRLFADAGDEEKHPVWIDHQRSPN
jgi:hypothetical protein